MQEEKWKHFFTEAYVPFSETILTPERTKVEVNQIIDTLGLPVGAKILDLGCGQGRISIPLALNGYNVTGYDASRELLDIARLRAKKAGAELTFMQGDMRELTFDAEFDAVINFGTAFGYLDNEEEDLHILRMVKKALKPNGHFLQETENRELKLKNMSERVWYEMNGQPVWSKREFQSQTGRWKETIYWMEGSEVRKTVLDLRLYSATELIRMTHQAGLQIEGVYGSMAREPLTIESLRMVLHSNAY